MLTVGGTCVALRDDGGDVAVVMIVGIALLLLLFMLLEVEWGVGGVVVELGKVYGMVAIAIVIAIVIGVIVGVLKASDVIQKIVE